MATMTTTADVPVNLKGFYDRTLLKNAVPAILFDMFGQRRPMPKNMGDRINFRNWGKLATNILPLQEGVTPTGKKPSVTDIYATVLQYGDYIMMSDWIQTVGLDPNVVDICENLLAQQMAESKDILARDVLVAGTTVRYGGGVSAATSIVTALMDDDMDSIVKTLDGNDSRRFYQLKQGSKMINTSPMGATYAAVTHTDCRYDVEHLEGFIPVQEYASRDSNTMQNGEVIEFGYAKGCRFFATTQAKIAADSGGSNTNTGLISTSGTSNDVYYTLVFGRDAYGTVPLQKGSINSIIKQLGSGGVEDALDQRSSVGYKYATVTKILNQHWMGRIEHGCTSR